MKKFYSIAVISLIAIVICGCNLGSKNTPAASRKGAPIVAATGIDWAKVPDDTKEQIVEYEGFRVSFNEDNKTPNWVAWELLGSESDGVEKRYDKFWQDENVRGCPTTKDYSNSGYDRGHMCPAADQKWSPQAMIDCFSLANMVPQDHSLNAGAWATLEKKERLWAQRDSAIVIIAGPIYEQADTRRIGNAGVRVPSAFFKVIVAPYLDEPRGIGFIYPNMSSPGNMKDYSMPIDEVEKITGIDFFYNLQDDIEERIEYVASFKEWDRRNK